MTMMLLMLMALLSYLLEVASVEGMERNERASVHDRMQIVWIRKSSMMIMTSLTFSRFVLFCSVYCV